MIKKTDLLKAAKFSALVLLMGACNSELETLEGTVKANADNPAVGNFECEKLTLKDVSNIPVAISFGNEQKKAETEGIINEVDRITSTEFFASIIWKGENTFDFSKSDHIVDYASKNGKQVHAHCLVYPLETVNPGWITSFQGSNEQLEQHFKNFITATVSRYKGKVKGYDITNELFAFSSSETQESWLRSRFSSDQEFFDFIGRCFRYAHAADPNAVLFYNDYGHEFSNNDFEKSRAIVEQIKKWQEEGVPVHGYGLQIHTNIYRPIEHIERALEMAVSTGLQVHISELDIAVNWSDYDVNTKSPGVQGLSSVSDELKEEQKKMYRKVAEAYKKVVPANQQYGITLWDLCDKYSWLNWNRFEAGTPFDDNYSRKPAFYGFMEGLSDLKIECN